jgi:hypothetical protein
MTRQHHGRSGRTGRLTSSGVGWWLLRSAGRIARCSSRMIGNSRQMHPQGAFGLPFRLLERHNRLAIHGAVLDGREWCWRNSGREQGAGPAGDVPRRWGARCSLHWCRRGSPSSASLTWVRPAPGRCARKEGWLAVEHRQLMEGVQVDVAETPARQRQIRAGLGCGQRSPALSNATGMWSVRSAGEHAVETTLSAAEPAALTRTRLDLLADLGVGEHIGGDHCPPARVVDSAARPPSILISTPAVS